VRPKLGAIDEKRYFVSCCFAPFVVRTLYNGVRPKLGAIDEKRYFVSCCFAPVVVRPRLGDGDGDWQDGAFRLL
jgi:hypothetical protein